MRVIILPEVVDYFLELADILYEKEYLGFEDSAIQYVKELFQDIQKKLPNKSKKKAPKYFDRYGQDMFYTSFKRNRNTSWYVFFNIYKTKDDTFYFVRHVSNNHIIAQYL